MIKKQLAVAIACALSIAASQQVYSANDVEIVDGAMQTNVTGGPLFTTTDDNAVLGVDDISTIWSSGSSDTVTVTTAESGATSQSGDVNFTGSLGHTGSIRNFLILNAHNNINLNGTISGDAISYYNGGLELALNPDSDALGGGVVNLNGAISGHVDTAISGSLNIGSTGIYNLNHLYASLIADSINISAGGAFNFTNGLLNLTNSDMTIGTGGLLGSNVYLSSNQDVILSNSTSALTIDTGASLTLSGGGLEVGGITNNGNFTFNYGDLTLTNSGLTAGSGGLLGASVVVAGSDYLTLTNNNVLTIAADGSVSLAGGSLSVGDISITTGGSFGFTSGHLELSNTGLTVGAAGLLGDNVALSGSRHLTVANDVTVESGATLSVEDITYTSNQTHIQSNLNNAGTVSVSGAYGSLTVDGTIANEGASASLTVDEGILSAGAITNANGGSFTFNSGQLNLTNSGMTVGTSGLLGGSVVLSPTRNLSVSGDIAIDNGAQLLVYGSTLSAGSITNTSGGIVNFTSGRLNLTNSGLVVGSTGLLGDNVALSGTRLLTVAGDVSVENAATLIVGSSVDNSESHFQSNLNNAGTVSVDNSLASPAGRLTVNGAITNDGAGASLTLDGGILRAGSISNINGGTFDFVAGGLYLTNSGLTVGATGLLGGNVVLGSGRYLNVSGDVAVDSGASLSVAGGAGVFQGDLNNAGTVAVSSASTSFTVNGVVTNDGAGANLTIDGGGVSVGSISNINGGSFNFNGGTLNLTNSALTVGSGGLLGTDVKLTNQHLSLTSNNPVNNTLTIDAAASLTLDGGSLSVGAISNNGSFAFNSGALTLRNSDFTVGASGLLGANVSLVAGQELDLYYGGALNIDSGAAFTLNGGSLYTSSIVNNGSFVYNSGLLSSSGNLAIGGGSAYAINSGSSLSLGSGGILTVDAGSSMVLNGGSLTVGNVAGSFSFNSGTLRLTDTNLTVGGGGLLGDTIYIGADKSLLLDQYYDSNLMTQLPDKTLTIASVGVVNLDGGYLQVGNIVNNGSFGFNSGSLSLTNSGLTVGINGLLGNGVSIDATKSLYVKGAVTIDSGASMSLDGGYLDVASIAGSGSFAFNSGELDIGNVTIGSGSALGSSLALDSSKSLNAGYLTVDTGATVNINGGSHSMSYVDNNGSFNFNSGHLALGNLTVGASGLLGDTVALSSSRNLSVYGTVSVDAGSNLSVASGVMSFSHLNNSGSVNVAGGTLQVNSYYGGTVTNNGSVAIGDGASMVVNGSNGASNYTQTSGHTNILAGGTLTVSGSEGGTYTQNGGTTTVNGQLTATSVVINAGTLKGSGTIDGNLEVWGGQLAPGNSPGVIEVTGDFVLTDAGTLHLEVGSDGLGGFNWDQLIVGGSYDIQSGSTITFSLLDGIDVATFDANFAMTDFFHTGTAGSDVPIDPVAMAFFGNADIYVHDLVLGTDGWYSMAFDGTGSFTAASIPAPVPVPAAIWLFGSGMLALIGVSRRRAQVA